MLLVEHAESGKRVRVVVNDRGPFTPGRVLDLSKKAARRIGMIDAGVAEISLSHRGLQGAVQRMLSAAAAASREFLAGLLRLPMVWQLWVAMLAVVNVLVPLAFLDREGPRGAGRHGPVRGPSALWLTHRQGFTKLLGLMHFPWFGLVAWLLPRLAEAPADTGHGQWLRLLIAMNLTSLCIDVVDVVRWWRGERDSV